MTMTTTESPVEQFRAAMRDQRGRRLSCRGPIHLRLNRQRRVDCGGVDRGLAIALVDDLLLAPFEFVALPIGGSNSGCFSLAPGPLGRQRFFPLALNPINVGFVISHDFFAHARAGRACLVGIVPRTLGKPLFVVGDLGIGQRSVAQSLHVVLIPGLVLQARRAVRARIGNLGAVLLVGFLDLLVVVAVDALGPDAGLALCNLLQHLAAGLLAVSGHVEDAGTHILRERDQFVRDAGLQVFQCHLGVVDSLALRLLLFTRCDKPRQDVLQLRSIATFHCGAQALPFLAFQSVIAGPAQQVAGNGVEVFRAAAVDTSKRGDALRVHSIQADSGFFQSLPDRSDPIWLNRQEPHRLVDAEPEVIGGRMGQHVAIAAVLPAKFGQRAFEQRRFRQAAFHSETRGRRPLAEHILRGRQHAALIPCLGLERAQPEFGADGMREELRGLTVRTARTERRVCTAQKVPRARRIETRNAGIDQGGKQPGVTLHVRSAQRLPRLAGRAFGAT